VSHNDRISQWVKDLKDGDPDAAGKLWTHYFRRLAVHARNKLPIDTRRAFDEEDVALSAFKSFCAGVERGRFPRLDDRNDLWRLLLTLTSRKARSYTRRERQQKRGHGMVQGELDLDFAELISDEPSPEFALLLAEECQRLLSSLGSVALRTIAALKLEGYTVDEIASRVGCARRSVERRLEIIRKAWSTDTPVPESSA
jgi:DNA-directed RNA polymerase specialized sigma24 family protein